MELGLEGKVALVLASSKGLGKSVAIELAKENAKVVICGRNKESLVVAQKEISEISAHEVLAISCDLEDEEDRKKLIVEVKEKWGNIDILVTNAGGPPTGPFEQFDSEDWMAYFNLLFVSAASIIKMVLPQMKEKRSGRILMISSVSIKQPVNNLIASNAVRSSLLGFMKSLANELGPFGITVNNLMPGFTLTERLEKLIEANPDFRAAEATIPMKRFGKPDEFAAAAAFLVSEKASYITGVSIPVDGGWIKGV